MTLIHCSKIKEVLSAAANRFGWDDYVYTFSQNKDWTDPESVFVRESSKKLGQFLEKYRELGLQINRFKFAALKSDVFKLYYLETVRHSRSAKERILSDLIDEYGWKTVLSCPVYGYGGALGIVALWSNKPSFSDEQVQSAIAYLTPLVHEFNAWSRELVQNCYLTAYALSPREVECMQLVAEGHTSREIAEILGITSRTVDFHVKNATEKLGGTSRSQAAWRMSLLPPQPLSAS